MHYSFPGREDEDPTDAYSSSNATQAEYYNIQIHDI